MGKFKDLKGQKFGRLTVTEYAGRAKGYQARWLCKCDCGNESVAYAGNLNSGHTQSCGCLQKDRTGETKTTHGLYYGENGKKSKLYRVWSSMKERCLSPNSHAYKDYGGRGISVCAEWLEYPAFHDWALANGYKDGLTVERIDNDGSYSPENCRFATRKEQANNKRNNRMVTFRGRTKILCEWGRSLGIKPSVLSNRLRRGWSVERALTQPVRRGNCEAAKFNA